MNIRILLAIPLAMSLAACAGDTRPAGFSATLPPPPAAPIMISREFTPPM